MEFDEKDLFDPAGKQEDIDRLRRKYEAFQKLADEYKKALDDLGGSGPFVGMAVKDAVDIVIKDKGKPLAVSVIVPIVIKGGATMGKRDEEKQVKNAIIARLKAGKLKRKPDIGKLRDTDLIALPDMEFPQD